MGSHEGNHQNDEQPVDLETAVRFALEEARMILPGIQALFGFQLVAVFNERFSDIFDATGQLLHLAALVLVALACALAMTPAAIHRQTARRRVSARQLALSSFFIGAAMIPLMSAISIDVGLVAYVVTESRRAAIALGAICALVFAGLWVGVPQLRKRIG